MFEGQKKMSKINLKATPETGAIRGAETKRTIPEKQPETAKNKAVTADKLEFSDRAATVGKLVDKLSETPEMRVEKVEALRAKIAAGEYQPSGESIADAILKDEK